MRDDFAIMIVTHARAKKQTTFQMLRKAGYAGKVYFVCDDQDPELEEYQKLYAEDVLIYSKAVEYPESDSMTNRKELTTPLYGYNYCFKAAKEKGLKCFAVCDDDLTRISLRPVINGKLKDFSVTDADRLFTNMMKYMLSANIGMLGPTMSGAYIGGVKNKKVQKGVCWDLSQMIFFQPDFEARFRCYVYPDRMIALDASTTGQPAFKTMLISIASPVQGTNSGGMSKSYEQDAQWYCRNFYAVMAYPSAAKINWNGTHYSARINSNYVHPKIINQRWRKEVE